MIQERAGPLAISTRGGGTRGGGYQYAWGVFWEEERVFVEHSLYCVIYPLFDKSAKTCDFYLLNSLSLTPLFRAISYNL